MPIPPKNSIIIVTYHNEFTIEECLVSIKQLTKIDFEIIIVDNSENLNTYYKVKKFKENENHINIELLKPEKNIGFAKGCNKGADIAKGEYLMFFNPDACLENDVSDILIESIDNSKDIFIAGPMIINKDGSIEKTCRNLPTLFNIFLDITGIDRFVGLYKLNRMPHQKKEFVPQIIGACLVIRRKVFIDIGKFDERFFVYFEEVDLCKRVNDAGLKILFNPEARVKHFRGISCESESTTSDMIVQLRKSRALYFNKHFGMVSFITLNLLNVIEGFAKGSVFFIMFIFKQNRKYLLKSRGFFRTALCLNF